MATSTTGTLDGTGHLEEPSGPRRRIMVLDDDPMVRRVLVRMLERMGFDVTGAANAEQAKRLFEECDGAYDLLVADISLGDDDGRKVAAELMARYATLRVLLVSGRSMSASKEEGRYRHLMKPFTPARLYDSIRLLCPPAAARL